MSRIEFYDTTNPEVPTGYTEAVISVSTVASNMESSGITTRIGDTGEGYVIVNNNLVRVYLAPPSENLLEGSSDADSSTIPDSK